MSTRVSEILSAVTSLSEVRTTGTEIVDDNHAEAVLGVVADRRAVAIAILHHHVTSRRVRGGCSMERVMIGSALIR